MIGHPPYHLHRVKFSELSEIYTSETIKAFAYSLIGIFIPIYLLKNGVPLDALCYLLFLQNALRLVHEYFIGKMIARYGAKHILALSYPISFIYILQLALYPSQHFPLLLIAWTWALADSMHWVAYQSVFSKVKGTKSSGKEISTMGILGIIVGSLGPIAGGYIAARNGLHAIFLVASVLLLLAMLPLYQSVEIIRSKRLKFGGLVSGIKDDLIAHAALSFDVVVGTIIWPLFIYFIVNDYLKLGAIISLSFLLSIAALFIIGKLSDVMNKKQLIVAGSSGMIIINIFRSLATTFWYALGINVIATILGPLLSTPLFSIFYNHADKTRRIEYTVLLEMAGDFARAAMWGILYLFSTIVSQAVVFRIAFLMAGIGLIATNLVKLNLHRN